MDESNDILEHPVELMVEQKRGRSYGIRLLPLRVVGHNTMMVGEGGVDDDP